MRSTPRSIKPIVCILLILAASGGCASADKRYEQGSEMEAKGRYEQAVMRYVQALEKDHTYEPARIRLLEAGNLAIEEQLADAEMRAQRGDPVGSASHFQRVDAVVAQARTVGVRLDVPGDYEAMRREAFDLAFADLIDQSAMAREQGRWQDGAAYARRAQRDFEPTADQRTRALAEEAGLYVDWSHAEYEMGHLRNAFDVAAQVRTLEWCPAEHAETAALVMEDCLAEGELELIVLPVQAKGKRRNSPEHYVSDQVEDLLWHGPWRQPPAFIAMNEPLTVRTLLDTSGMLDGNVNAATMALILRLAEADYAAYLQVIDSEVNEYDVKARTESVKTRRGQPTTFVKETGKMRIRATARILIADGFGNKITDEVVTGTGTAPFARGVYAGDPADLNLSSRQVDLFDGAVLADQEMAAHHELAQDLARKIADTVFGRTLAMVP